jgi:hypothetical protein
MEPDGVGVQLHARTAVVAFWRCLRGLLREFTTRTFVPHPGAEVAFPRNLLVAMRAG